MTKKKRFYPCSKTHHQPAPQYHISSVKNIAVNNIDNEFYITGFASEDIDDEIHMTIKSHYRKETQQPKTPPET